MILTIKELININLANGYRLKDAQNVAAEEIIIRKIASSPMAKHVTLKGGIVMYNLTKNSRRVTQDIDFDLIKYSIDKESIKLFIEKMNNVNDGFTVYISGDIEDLNQEDYRGVRIHIVIKDITNSSLKIKLDIGVHTYSAIEQDNALFAFASDSRSVSINVNPPEQIFSEKLISLARLGPVSTRYKDLYDLYYLIKECNISVDRVRSITEMFLTNSKRKPNSFFEICNAVENTLNQKAFTKEASKPAAKWLDIDFETLKQVLLEFIYKL